MSWVEVLGGPPRCSQSCGDQSGLLHMHAGNGDMGDLGRRFVDCLVQAADDAALPQEPEFREAFRAYMKWAVDGVLVYSPQDPEVPAGVEMPHWVLGRPSGTARLAGCLLERAELVAGRVAQHGPADLVVARP